MLICDSCIDDKTTLMLVQFHCGKRLKMIFFLSFQLDPKRASFHLPLHRYFSVFVRQAVMAQDFTLEQLLPDTEFLTLLMQHPLRVQVGQDG